MRYLICSFVGWLLVLSQPAMAQGVVDAILTNPLTTQQSLAVFQQRAQQDNYEVCVGKMKEFAAQGKKVPSPVPDYCHCMSEGFAPTAEEFIQINHHQPTPTLTAKMDAQNKVCVQKFPLRS